MPDYDAFLLVSFGGPDGPDDVMPFLRNVTAGRNVPPDRLAEVASHYQRFGGVSPINAQCRELLAAIEKDFAASALPLPVYWGNRNWHPFLTDTMRAMTAAGVRHAVAFATSAYSSYSSCRQYLADIAAARGAAGPGAPRIDKLTPFFDHPGFIGSFAAAATAAIRSLPGGLPAEDADLVFTAHSIPVAMESASGPRPRNGYTAQLEQVAALVAARVRARSWRLAYTSRSGPPTVPWLEPDINDCLADLAAGGSRGVVIIPVGFVSDHMEVLFDLDVEAAQTAARLRLPMARAATPGTDPRFVSMITSLVQERLSDAAPRRLSDLGTSPEFCQPGCCGLAARGPSGRA